MANFKSSDMRAVFTSWQDLNAVIKELGIMLDGLASVDESDPMFRVKLALQRAREDAKLETNRILREVFGFNVAIHVKEV